MITLQEEKEILEKEYHCDNFLWVANHLLSDLKLSEHSVQFNNKLFENVTELGTSKSCDITIYQVILKKGIEKRRVQITQEMFKILRGVQINNAFVAFSNADNQNFRISLLTSNYEWQGEKIVKIISNPRRYSYSLGIGAKTKTADKYLIRDGKVNSLLELQGRFSAEVVNKEFYGKIAIQFTKLVGGQRDKILYKKMLNLYSINDQNKYTEFAVRLIGRIVFCWFLKEKKSTSGLPLVPEEILSISGIEQNSNYYHSVLEPLFFEVLNTKIERRKGKFAKEKLYKQIPYLNGGLFSPHIDDHYKYDSVTESGICGVVTIPDKWFEELYTILSEYNFTVDENTSYDIELSIDPEMLGRIFENLLAEINPETGESAKKSTGSFYTPRDIVDYMVDSSIYEYLREKTGIENNKLKAIISYGKEEDEHCKLEASEKKLVVCALYDMTTLDPACGSGAFPIGLLQKIVYIFKEIDPEANLWFDKATEGMTNNFIKREFEKQFTTNSLEYILKLNVIQKSIFGIDIQPIAVEIARLRCFLSLIIEERIVDNENNRGIKPLPNLDFKFVIANSLISLECEVQINIFEDTEHIEKLKNIREEYFSATEERRIELIQDFKNIQNIMFDTTLKHYKKSASQKYSQLTNWKPFENEPTSWFDPEWIFGIKDGFDIVIANPPYVDYRKITNFTKRNVYKVAKASTIINLYVYFFEAGINMLKNNGVLAYISPQQYLILEKTKGLRDIFRQHTVVSLSDFSFANVFEAGTYPFITVLQKKKTDRFLTYREFNQTTNLEKFMIELSISNPIPEPMIITKHKKIMDIIENSKLSLNSISRKIFVACRLTQERKVKAKFAFLEASDLHEHKIQPVRSFIDFSNKYSSNSKNAQMGDVIYTSRMTTSIRAVYVENNNKYLGGKVNVIIPLNNNGYFIVALLNSKIINFWFKERFAMTHMQGGAFPINAEDLEKIPIPVYNEVLQIEIQNNAKKLYMDNMDNEKRQTCLAIIDKLFYQYFNLSLEEIAIIENVI